MTEILNWESGILSIDEHGILGIFRIFTITWNSQAGWFEVKPFLPGLNNHTFLTRHAAKQYAEDSIKQWLEWAGLEVKYADQSAEG